MKIKANILLITLFLLMMSSLSALLVTAYIRNLIRSSAVFHNYYRSYYIANAGLELALVKTNGKVRGYGFEDVVLSGSTTVTNNFGTGKIYFDTSIKTSSGSLGDANTSNPAYGTGCNAETVREVGFEVPPGGCVPIILLRDNVDMTAPGQGEGRLIDIDDQQLSVIQTNPTIFATTGFTALATKIKTFNDEIIFDKGWSKTFTGNSMQEEGGARKVTNILTSISPEAVSDLSSRYILMIANTDPVTTGYYCMLNNSNQIVPTQYVTISSQGSYNNVTLDLKGVRKAGLPADFCYTAISN